MGQGFHRMISLFLTFVFILSALVTGTYGWQSLQTITNETAATIAQVRLQKKEKLNRSATGMSPMRRGRFPCACPPARTILKRMPRRRRLLSTRKTGNPSHSIHLPCRREARSR